MNGLRVYINAGGAGLKGGAEVFYSRRSGGPYYRWDYQEQLEQWRVVRMHAADFRTEELCVFNWKTVPPALQMRLKDHYQE